MGIQSRICARDLCVCSVCTPVLIYLYNNSTALNLILTYCMFVYDTQIVICLKVRPDINYEQIDKDGKADDAATAEQRTNK